MTTREHRPGVILAALAALIMATAQAAGQAGGGRPTVTGPADKRATAAELLKAARLELMSGRPDIALGYCTTIRLKYPDDTTSTPAAMLMGAEILMGRRRPGEARQWIEQAQRMFPRLKEYQDRMAVLHRRNLARITEHLKGRINMGLVWDLLNIGYRARGLSHQECRIRWYRFWREVRHHRRYWDRAGKVGEGDGSVPPSGMRRHMELLTARLARDCLADRGIRLGAMDDIVDLLRQRLVTLERIWARSQPDPADTRGFTELLATISSRLARVKAEIRHLRRRPCPGAKGRQAKEASGGSGKGDQDPPRTATKGTGGR